MYYVYVLHSAPNNKLYTGYSSNLKQRLKEHLQGKVYSTKFKTKLELIYFEGCVSKIDALRREQYLKSGTGKKYLRSRLKFWQKEKYGSGPEKTF